MDRRQARKLDFLAIKHIAFNILLIRDVKMVIIAVGINNQGLFCRFTNYERKYSPSI